MRVGGPDLEMLLIKILCDRAVISFGAIRGKGKRKQMKNSVTKYPGEEKKIEEKWEEFIILE
jgi:hypothetical protein